MILIVIMLITTGILLITLNVNAIKKEKKSFDYVLNNKKEDTEEYKIEIGKFRKEFAETILEIQQEMEELKEKIGKEQTIEQKPKNESAYELINKQIEIEEENISKDEIHKINNETQSTEVNKNAKVNKNNKENKENKDNKIKSNKEIKNNENSLNNILKVSENSEGGYYNNSVKINEINRMIEEKLSVDEIAEKVGIGKGEVLLIKELYIK